MHTGERCKGRQRPRMSQHGRLSVGHVEIAHYPADNGNTTRRKALKELPIFASDSDFDSKPSVSVGYTACRTTFLSY